MGDDVSPAHDLPEDGESTPPPAGPLVAANGRICRRSAPFAAIPSGRRSMQRYATVRAAALALERMEGDNKEAPET